MLMLVAAASAANVMRWRWCASSSRGHRLTFHDQRAKNSLEEKKTTTKASTQRAREVIICEW